MSEEPAQPVQESNSQSDVDNAEKLAKQEEIDSRSIYVGNVDYQSTPEQLEQFFHVVGIIERVTILFDRFSGLPKGYAYIEFEKSVSVQQAIDELNGKEFRGRELRVTSKRTNLPGFRKRGGGRGRGRGGRGRGRGGRGRGRGGRGRGGRNSDETSENASVPTEPSEEVDGE
ncbi:uncharacterized protein SPAPADRAFT_60154 [Spathaspora passalidarum NRRL Y-27907]|uniref:RRM domain-containing protein n=1 Tax=Spathaspora passalidarum (strain NRRL Y-27907 / 11-Y1) TaxID=619300 RepID=G3AMF7_SPAPN|nr:uncharacterized protein SPAPADRAFT_60154 [Spathaspora passalidarum NRRL Y-27907]EGW32809.1 hypothetical protein SPAPADRAFT_60154 [Spathaspora passalidarum NRRL Y-27907]